jgi:hypothetical protein
MIDIANANTNANANANTNTNANVEEILYELKNPIYKFIKNAIIEYNNLEFYTVVSQQ